jgi:Ca2+-binding RTX toxin-like protein
MLRAVADGVQFLTQIALVLTVAMVWAAPAQAAESAYAEQLCATKQDGETCGPGHGRRSEGGGEKVSHAGWPAVTGILWMVTTQDRSARTLLGGPLNDELLGHHGSDRITGAAGRDILWGDWDPRNNSSSQRDVLSGGAGNDFLYPSHGSSKVLGGPGNDSVWAYYGRGTIDCGPGKDRVRIKWIGNRFKVRNCEIVRHFCAFGSRPDGGCYKPGEKPRKG